MFQISTFEHVPEWLYYTLCPAITLDKELKDRVKKPFTSVIKANIGEAHAMENKPITFIKQVLALITNSPLLDTDHFPEDVKGSAKIILAGCNKGGIEGSYSDTPGLEVNRRYMTDYIMATRDGGIECDWKNLILLAGYLRLLEAAARHWHHSRGHVMIPIAQ